MRVKTLKVHLSYLHNKQILLDGKPLTFCSSPFQNGLLMTKSCIHQIDVIHQKCFHDTRENLQIKITTSSNNRFICVLGSIFGLFYKLVGSIKLYCGFCIIIPFSPRYPEDKLTNLL